MSHKTNKTLTKNIKLKTNGNIYIGKHIRGNKSISFVRIYFKTLCNLIYNILIASLVFWDNLWICKHFLRIHKVKESHNTCVKKLWNCTFLRQVLFNLRKKKTCSILVGHNIQNSTLAMCPFFLVSVCCPTNFSNFQ